MAEPEFQDQNSPAAVTVMTTEHFVLQTARSAGIAEVNGRAGFYLAAVSSGLIALAFIGQLSRLGTAFYVFGLAVLPTLAFVGVTTFERALRNGVEDFQLAGQINRIRQFYFDAAPHVARYLPPPSPDIPAPSYRPSWVPVPDHCGSAGRGQQRPDRRRARPGRAGQHRNARRVGGGGGDHRCRGAGRAPHPAAGHLADRTAASFFPNRGSRPLTPPVRPQRLTCDAGLPGRSCG